MIKYDGTIIKCKVDVPLAPDDSVIFKVKRSTTYNCTRFYAVEEMIKEKIIFLIKMEKIRGNSKSKKVNVIYKGKIIKIE